MQPAAIPQHDDFANFRQLYAALNDGPDHLTDNAWLRYAAQILALRNATAAATVTAVRDIDRQLKGDVARYDPMRAPLRLVVAANLVQIGDSVDGFEAALMQTREQFRAAGIHAAGTPGILTALALRIMSQGRPVTAAALERVKAIHDAMRRHHWWLTDANDLPVCAALSFRQGSAEALESETEGIYQALRIRGLVLGDRLQTAACLLTLPGIGIDDATSRFLGLARELSGSGIDVIPVDYDALALLCLLDHPPTLVVQRYREAIAMLGRTCQPDLTEVNEIVAANLTVMDLLQFDRNQQPLSGEEAHRHGRLHQAAALSLVRPTPESLL